MLVGYSLFREQGDLDGNPHLIKGMSRVAAAGEGAGEGRRRSRGGQEKEQGRAGEGAGEEKGVWAQGEGRYLGYHGVGVAAI